MTTTATIPNSDIVFRRDRDGSRALVLVHGFLDDQHVWGPVLAGLSAPGFETVQFDQAGFGDRTEAAGPVTYDRFAADLGAVVDAIGKPFVLELRGEDPTTRERKLAGWARAVKGLLASDEGEG